MKRFLPLLCRYLQLLDDETTADALRALASLTVATESTVSDILAGLDAGLIIKHILHPTSQTIKMYALRIVGNMCAGAARLTDEAVLKHDALGAIKTFLEAPEKATAALQREACWIVSNIAAGTFCQSQAVIEKGVVEVLMKTIEGSADHYVKHHWIHKLV